jgi:hypothetical protein
MVSKLKDQAKEFLSEHKKEVVAIFLVFLGTIALVWVLNYYPIGIRSSNSMSAKPYVPQEFLDARSLAGDAANELVDLIKGSQNSLRTISEEDAAGNYTKALELVLSEINRNTTIRETAVEFSSQLEKMTKNLAGVSPKNAADIGFQAVTTEIELVQHLLTYNKYTQDLLTALRSRFEVNGTVEKRQKIEELIGNMNKEADSINSLNEKYKNLMGEFDKLTVN